MSKNWGLVFKGPFLVAHKPFAGFDHEAPEDSARSVHVHAGRKDEDVPKVSLLRFDKFFEEAFGFLEFLPRAKPNVHQYFPRV